ncbi:hypothetical protein RJ55_08323 [Drechmeria coniospora]|nr:hypothetical protein RJ55_08323 [Drechmeria coniospora]
MRIRLPFAAVFALLLLLAGYAGLSTFEFGSFSNDKVLHAVTFFLLTLVFYWVVDTNRRRTVNMTLVVCTLSLGIGSEFLQSFLPNNRDFDMYDIFANVAGSLAGVALCSWYHKRMMERRRKNKTYNTVPGEEDVELGEDQETGVTGETSRGGTLEEEVDNWDEHAPDDWEGEGAAEAPAPARKGSEG